MGLLLVISGWGCKHCHWSQGVIEVTVGRSSCANAKTVVLFYVSYVRGGVTCRDSNVENKRKLLMVLF